MTILLNRTNFSKIEINSGANLPTWTSSHQPHTSYEKARLRRGLGWVWWLVVTNDRPATWADLDELALPVCSDVDQVPPGVWCACGSGEPTVKFFFVQASHYAKTHTCCELKKSTFKVLPFTVSLGFFVNGVLFMRLQKKLFLGIYCWFCKSF